jgi:ParB-like chromosome segregation protein Spo0J
MSDEFDYPIHPVADIFPLMTEAEFEGLKEDIRKHGQRTPVTVWCEQVIDGRHRLRACRELGRTPEYEELDYDQDPYSHVVSQNLHRRSLSASQRGIVAGKLANLQHGTNRFEKKVEAHKCVSTEAETEVGNQSVTIQEAAKALNVSERLVDQAKKVIAEAAPEVVKDIEAGKTTVGREYAKLTKPKDDKPKPAKSKSLKSAFAEWIDEFIAVDHKAALMIALCDHLSDAEAAIVADELHRRLTD